MINVAHSPLPSGRLADLVHGSPVAVLGFGVSNRPLVSFVWAHTSTSTIKSRPPRSEMPPPRRSRTEPSFTTILTRCP